jgi:hypothetical protein
MFRRSFAIISTAYQVVLGSTGREGYSNGEENDDFHDRRLGWPLMVRFVKAKTVMNGEKRGEFTP